MTTSQMLNLYSRAARRRRWGARVVYVDGGWDMFHAGHVAFLADVRARGDYLLAGVHNDAVVNRHRGRNFPLLNLNERVLGASTSTTCSSTRRGT